MKQYPSIPKQINTSQPVFVFDKLDGSNIRAEWSQKQGFYKFGSRKQLIDSQTKYLGEAIEVIKNDFQPVHSWLLDNKHKQAVIYFEFFGDNSFAGQHIDEPHVCALLDIEIANKGFISPQTLVKDFVGKVRMPRVVAEDIILDNSTIERYSAGNDPNITFEGVVCKAKTDPKMFHNLMFKIKTDKWINKVKSLYKDSKILLDLL